MMQILLHLLGDYITQTNKMALRKTSSWGWAIAHGAVYTLPFAIIYPHQMWAICVIMWSHIIIDRLRLAKYLVFAKNRIDDPSLKWEDCTATGYHKDTPPWLAFWLLILCDNTIHLWINCLALKYL